MSWNEFRTRFTGGVHSRIWAQWTALGVPGTSRHDPVSVDLEALLLGTFSIGRSDPRIFDEALSWCCRFGDLVNTQRLNKLLEEVSETSTAQVAGAWAETIKERGNVDWGLGLEPQAFDSAESLFFDHKIQAHPIAPTRDPVFETWGLFRAPFDPRDLSMPPNLEDLQLTQLFARKLVGVSCRSEVLAMLVLGVEATTSEFADMAMYSRRLVQTVLGDFKDAGLLDWEPGRGRTTRAMLRSPKGQVLRSLVERPRDTSEMEGSIEVRDWPGFYLGLHALWIALVRIERDELTGFKAQSILRDALEQAATLHRRTSLKSVNKPTLSASSMEELVRESHAYLAQLLPE